MTIFAALALTDTNASLLDTVVLSSSLLLSLLQQEKDARIQELEAQLGLSQRN
jgi:hypothetical protein